LAVRRARSPTPWIVLLPLLIGVVTPGGARAETPVPVQRHTAYVAGLEDVPLMAGLIPTHANDVAFDSPLGRIVIVNTEGALERQSVLAFYAASMSELGWDRIGDTAFRREGELLRLELGQKGSLLTVRFALSPVH
jgi:hypothetical protein